MNRPPQKPGDNVVPMPSTKLPESRKTALEFPAAADTLAAAGSPDDSRMREAMRLIEAFLAIEDTTARSALIALAESVVSHDWLRKAGRR
ncbi:MAG: hypothetical protein ACREB2_04650 [Pseudolabrys sp.]